MGMNVHITNISEDMLLKADELFFTGTASEVTPIASIDNILINKGLPGKITLQLRDLYLRIVHGNENRYKKWLTRIMRSQEV